MLSPGKWDVNQLISVFISNNKLNIATDTEKKYVEGDMLNLVVLR
jgi:hypothetical protein